MGASGVRLSVATNPGPASDAPSLLLHHGLASSRHIWDLMVPRLTRRFRVVTYDARGHGRSAKPSSGYGFDRTVADLLAVARAERLGRPIVVGHSWGAMVALEAAARHPSRLAGAVLVDGGLVGPGLGWDWPTTARELAPPMLSGMPLETFRSSIAQWSPIPVTPEIEAIFLSLMRVDRDARIHPRLSRANHLRILRKIWEQRPIERYAELRVPTLVILARPADRDETEAPFLEAKRAGLAAARRAATGLPVTFTWMRGAHDLPLDRPAALCARIERFAETAVG